MHIAVASVTVGEGGTLVNGDHRDSHACIRGKFLPEAESRSEYALVTIFICSNSADADQYRYTPGLNPATR
jgi:hypothetical protein